MREFAPGKWENASWPSDAPAPSNPNAHVAVQLDDGTAPGAGEGETANMSELWARIQREIESCERLVLYAEPEDLPLKGALIEAGIALALGKPVFVVFGNSPKESDYKALGSWTNHPLVSFANSVVAAMKDDLKTGCVAPPNTLPAKCGNKDFSALPADKTPTDIDSIALEASREIVRATLGTTMPGREVQLQARVQCIVIDALKQVAASPQGAALPSLDDVLEALQTGLERAHRWQAMSMGRYPASNRSAMRKWTLP
jgi:hypothetical protein